jgi:hypothetical protein
LLPGALKNDRALRKALTESHTVLTDPPVDSQLAWLQAFRHVLQRIEQGEEGLYEPAHAGDCFALVLAAME